MYIFAFDNFTVSRVILLLSLCFTDMYKKTNCLCWNHHQTGYSKETKTFWMTAFQLVIFNKLLDKPNLFNFSGLQPPVFIYTPKPFHVALPRTMERNSSLYALAKDTCLNFSHYSTAARQWHGMLRCHNWVLGTCHHGDVLLWLI